MKGRRSNSSAFFCTSFQTQLKGEFCADLIRKTTSRNKFPKGKKSSRVMHMVLEYLEIAERMKKRIRVFPYPVDSPENGGVEFYLHLY